MLTFSLNDGQTLTTPEQTALQTKIGVSGGSASAVLFTAQTLTAPQQTQALTNQGVTAAGRITGLDVQTLLDGGAYGSYGVASTFYTGVLTPEMFRAVFGAVRTYLDA